VIDDTEPKWKTLLWPDVSTNESANAAVKKSLLGGTLMILGLIVGFISIFSVSPAVLGWETVQSAVLVQLLQIALVCFLTWRTYRGLDRISPIVLFLWLGIEVAGKATLTYHGLQENRVNGVVPLLLWIWAALSVLHAVRASETLHNIRKSKKLKIHE
jgi:hypothetical protein